MCYRGLPSDGLKRKDFKTEDQLITIDQQLLLDLMIIISYYQSSSVKVAQCTSLQTVL